MNIIIFVALVTLGMVNSHSMMGGDMDQRDQRPDDRGQGQGDDRPMGGDRGPMDGDDDDRMPEGPQRPQRVWAIGMGRNSLPFEFLDTERGMVVGMGVDIARAACRAQNQHCEFVFFKNYTDCWDSATGMARALSNHWFDVCANYNPTFERSLVYGFTRSFVQEEPNELYLRRNDDLNIRDLMRPGNDIPIGFRRGFWLNPDCLRRHSIMVNDERTRMYDSLEELMEALRRGEVRVAFTARHEYNGDLFQVMDKGGRETPCSDGGPAFMTRKDNMEFIQWMNRGLQQVMRSPEYARLCYIWHEIFGVNPHCFDPREIGDGDDQAMPPRDGPPAPRN